MYNTAVSTAIAVKKELKKAEIKLMRKDVKHVIKIYKKNIL